MSGDGKNGFDDWGGYMEAKITKLEQQFAASSDPFRKTNLFAGISIFVNGLTNPSSDELKRIMMTHGGIFHHYERSHTTYIIASNLPDVKVRNWNTSKVIRPEWVTDCIKANRIVDYTKYLLCTNQKQSQPRLMFPKEKEAAKNLSNVENQYETDNELKTIPHTSVQKNNSIPTNEQKNACAVPTTSAAARTAVDPKFLAEFYNNSRLHHIASLGAGFKQYVHDLRAKNSGTFPARENINKKLLEAMRKGEVLSVYTPGRWVMHIDIDCFFVSVGLKKMPHLRGLPVAVTHSKAGNAEFPVQPGVDRQLEMELFAKRFENHLHNNILSEKVRSSSDNKMSLSEIASCSYEARSKGVRNGMFVGQALKLCPDLRTIPYDFEGYKEVAYALYDIIAQYTLDIEAVSCDEMFVDLTEVLKELQVGAMDFVSLVREEVRSKTSCPCSAGVGTNKLQARMATKKAKPDGQYQLDMCNLENFMSQIPISELPGVGSSTSYNLKNAGLITCGDLQQETLGKIQMLVGKKFGETLHQFCRGIDNRPLIYEQIRKSVSAEVNYGIRFNEFKELETFLNQLCLEVHSRLMDIKRKTKCITLKIMIRAKEAPVETSKFMGHGVCDHLTKSVSLSDYTCDPDVITRTVLTTMKALDVPPKELRGIGIQLSKLDETSEYQEKSNTLKAMFSRVSNQKKLGTKQELSKSKSPPSALPEKQRKNVTILDWAKKTNTKKMSQNASAQKKQFTYDPNTIDSSVLAELPEDIRLEILREQSVKIPVLQKTSPQKKQRCHKKTNQMSLGNKNIILKHLEKNITKENNRCDSMVDLIEDENIQTENMLTDNIFLQPECNRLLLAWMQSSPSPEKCDVELISDHATNLVRSRRIHDLYDPLVFLCRIISNKQNNTICSWHRAYSEIIEKVQCEMRQTYENQILFFAEKISCLECNVST